jgi:hypothetical protein
MEIWVEFNSGKFRTSPDPAIVPRGTPIVWRFRADNAAETARIRWMVYFDRGTPFGDKSPPFATTLSGQVAGQHSAATTIAFADNPGDYKYGVRAEDASSGKQLGDDDPMIVVLA